MLRRAFLLVWSMGMTGCAAAAEGKPLDRKAEVTLMAKDLDLVRKHRILFSHHSVGRNLLAGLERAAGQVGTPVRVMSLEQAEANPEPAFVTISGGRNQDPQSKFDFFAEALRKTEYEPELAFMKLCYVDFNPHTDVDALFTAYRNTIDTLRAEHPNTRFAHVTVPLYAQPTALKERIYRLLGKEVWEDAANMKRHAFNQRLMQTYAKDPIFDLARFESTRPDGSRVTFEEGGHTYYSLAPEYSDDGGHLNDLGQDVAALEWVRFMAQALRRSGN